MADDGEGSGGGIVGFLFGNVNERGELEDNGLLDEVSESFIIIVFSINLAIRSRKEYPVRSIV